MSTIFFGAEIRQTPSGDAYLRDVVSEGPLKDYFKARVRLSIVSGKETVAFRLENPAPHLGLIGLVAAGFIIVFNASLWWWLVPAFFFCTEVIHFPGLYFLLFRVGLHKFGYGGKVRALSRLELLEFLFK